MTLPWARAILPPGCLLLVVSGIGIAAPIQSHPPMRPAPQPRVGASLASAAYFVEPQHGWDETDGSKTSPWKTLERALRRLKPGDTLYLRSGTYYEHPYLDPLTSACNRGARLSMGGCLCRPNGPIRSARRLT